MGAKFIPGEGEVYKGYIPAVTKILHVTLGVASANPDVAVDATGVYNIVDVTVPVVVLGVWTQTEEAFTTSLTITLGDSDGADRYLADTTINPAASGAVLIASTGLTVPYVDAVGLDINATTAGATCGAGLLHVYIQYAELND